MAYAYRVFNVYRVVLSMLGSFTFLASGVPFSPPSAQSLICVLRTRTPLAPLFPPCQVSHVAESFERILSHPRATSGQFFWAVDFNGFGLTHSLQGKIGIGFAMTLSHHYPERLGRLLLINPPRLFDVLLGACRPFVSKRTMDKLCSIHGSADDVIAHMTTVHGFDETTTSWFREVCLGDTARRVVVMVVIVMAVVAMVVVVAALCLSMWQWQLVVPCS